jgi:hypothetical protein
MAEYNLEAMLAEMEIAATRTREALDGKYKSEFRELRALDAERIKDITPDTTDEAIYEKLMIIVREASRNNLEQAELAGRIRELGQVGLQIARMVPSLSVLV